MRLDFVEEQIANVLGYVQTLWKESEFARPQEKLAASPTVFVQEEEERSENSVVIAQDLAGIDLHIKKAADTPTQVQIVVEPKEEPKVEEPKIDPKIIKRQQMVEKLVEQIPDYEYMLAKTINNAEL